MTNSIRYDIIKKKEVMNMRKFIVITDNGNVASEGWDFPLEEIDYLLEEHNGEVFILKNGRLWETDSFIPYNIF